MINHLMYTDAIKLYAKNEKVLMTNNENIQSGYRNGIGQRELWWCKEVPVL